MSPMALVGQILQWALVVIVGGLFFLLISMVLARFFNEVALGVINNVFAFIGWPFRVVIKLVEWVVDQLETLGNGAKEGMQEEWRQVKRNDKADRLGINDIVGAAFLFVILFMLGVGDLYFTAIRLAELFGGTPPPLSTGLTTPITMAYWISTLIAVAAACADAWGLTSILPMYTGATGVQQLWLRRGTLIGFFLLLLGGLLQGLYSWELVSTTTLPIVDALLSAMIFILGVIATTEMGVQGTYEFLGFVVMVPFILRVIPTLLAFLLNIPVAALDRIADILVNIYAVLAGLGLSFWNWFSQQSQDGRWRLRFTKMPVWEKRKHIADAITVFGIN